MDNDKNPVEQAVELFVYAPLGLALDARELMPKLVERGRNQVNLARMIGKFAVSQGQVVAGKHLSTVEQQVQSALESFGLVAPSSGNGQSRPAEPASTRSPANLTAVPDVVEVPDVDDVPDVVEPEDAEIEVVVPDLTIAGLPTDDDAPADDDVPAEPSRSDVSALAIPDYDSLAASQVIPRLAGLSAAELDAVRRYESAKRGRKTILSRITQLQSA